MTEDTPETVRDWLVSSLEGSADWRQRKAEEYPGDARNATCAAALAQAAREVAALPADDPRLVTLERLPHDEEAWDSYSEVENLIIARHGFDSAGATTDDLLDRLVDEAEGCILSSLDDRLSE